ncbi:LON peptidase substrate-binding domain-containing protein [Hydrogenophaga sp. 5NK40-0174]|uniref:LON peptidase substrate-binding domain-containing protein n=1 Tax=Hydrogenophaga sp. 5NK40-0174 TaxID=3127649 RepID=UPI003108564F
MTQTETETPLRLAQLPLFPLQTVLFPGGRMSLRVFEVRYLDMINRCERAGAPFGVVLLTQGGEVLQRTQNPEAGEQFVVEEFESVGTLASIEHIERPQPGLLLVHCQGQSGFRIERKQKLQHGLWVADVQLRPSDAGIEVPEHLLATRDALRTVFLRIEAEGGEAEKAAIPPSTDADWNSSSWVSNRWLELLPVPANLKQKLMALDNPMVRLELVADLLEKLGLNKASGQ